MIPDAHKQQQNRNIEEYGSITLQMFNISFKNIRITRRKIVEELTNDTLAPSSLSDSLFVFFSVCFSFSARRRSLPLIIEF